MSEKTSRKQEQENQILIGLVDLYIKTGKPIGSHTLKEAGFEHISSATIRNYCGKLEESGFLKQQHSSGGRIPTDLAFQFYARHSQKKEYLSKKQKQHLEQQLSFEGKEVSSYLEWVAKLTSELTHCAVFLSSPRFDQDMIIDIKFVLIDQRRLLGIILTSFGLVRTELFDFPTKLSQHSLKRIENYIKFKMQALGEMSEIDDEEKKLAEMIYHEMMLKHIVSHANFITEDVIKTGYSELLHYPELHDASLLSQTLALMENPFALQKICELSCYEQDLKCWIGHELEEIISSPCDFSIIAIPYYVHQKPVGALGILGPLKISYRELFETLRIISHTVSDVLTESLFKHQITYRIPQSQSLSYEKDNPLFIKQTQHLLLEQSSPGDSPSETLL